MKKYFFLLLGAVAILGVWSSATAEESAKPTETEITMRVVADVNIVDASLIEQKDHNIRLAFSLENRDGAQSDVRYGIRVIGKDAKGIKYTAFQKIFEEKINLAEHTTVKRELSIDIPQYFTGTFDIAAVAENGEGLPLGYSTLGNVVLQGDSKYIQIDSASCHLFIKDFPETYTLGQGVDVSAKEQLSLSCEAKNMSTDTMTVKTKMGTYLRSIFGDEMKLKNNEQSFTFASEEKKRIDIMIIKPDQPQAYDVAVSLIDGEGKNIANTIYAHYVVQGKSASISNLQLNKSVYTKDEMITTTFIWSSSADSFFGSRSGGTQIGDAYYTMSILDENGKECVAPINHTKLDQTDVIAKVEHKALKDCAYPAVALQIEDANKNVLAKEVFNFAKQGSKKMENGISKIDNSMKKIAWYVVGIITLAALLSILVYAVKNKSLKILVFFLASGGIFIFHSHSAQALTLVADEWGVGMVKYAACNFNLSSTTLYPNQAFQGETSGCRLVNCLNWMDMTAKINGATAFHMDVIDDGGLAGTSFTFSGGDSYSQSVVTVNNSISLTAPGSIGAYAFPAQVSFYHASKNETYYGNGALSYSVIAPPPINGVCGAANGGSYAIAPTVGLCSSGIPSAVTDVGWWSWGCSGLFGGTGQSCGANKIINATCGTNATTYPVTTSSWPGASFCAAGSGLSAAAPAFMNPGTSATWTCLGASGGASISCTATRQAYPLPTVTLSAVPNPITNLNNNSQTVGTKSTTLTWNITNVASACGSGCTCSLTGPSGTLSGQSFPSQKTYVATLGAGTHSFSVTCTNPTSGTGTANTNVATQCSPPAPWDDGCNVTCGNGVNPHHVMQTNCSISTTYPVCSLPACPITSEWVETKP
ncbi:MAG: hypothetical protein WC682_01560 [Parcubacteria group bacterium]|jgi:hypothetical protein